MIQATKAFKSHLRTRGDYMLRRLIATSLGVALGVALAMVGTAAMASRNSSGTYSLPNSPFVSGTVINSNTMNSNLSDISSALTDSLDRTGRGSMSAQLKLYDGTVTAPGLGFSLEPGTGFYRAGTRDFRFALNGTLRSQWSDAGFDWTAATADGASAVAHAFDTTTSLANAAAKLVSVQNAGSEKFYVDKDGGVAAPLVQQVTANSTLTLKGNRSGADSGADVVLNSAATRTAGALADFQNNGTPKLTVDYAGEFSVCGGMACGVAFKTDADQTEASASMTNVTGMAFPVLANGLYFFEIFFTGDVNNSSGGVEIRFTGPAAPTKVDISYNGRGPVGSAVGGAGTTAYATAFSSAIGTTSSSANIRAIGHVVGFIQNGANAGTVQMQFARGGAAGTATIYKGAVLRWRRIA